MEKIDIINGIIYIYDEQFKLTSQRELSQLNKDYNFLSGEYKLITINLTKPTKRLIKFTQLNDLDTVALFTEYLYVEMSVSEKEELDDFINIIK